MKSFVHGGNIYKEKPACGEWLDYSANINPLGLSAKVREAIVAGVSGLVNYPEPDGASLKAVLSKKYAISEANIVLGNGAAELFYLFMHAYNPQRVLLPVPSFSEYERASLAVGAEIQYFRFKEENGFPLFSSRFFHSFFTCSHVKKRDVHYRILSTFLFFQTAKVFHSHYQSL